MKSSSKIEWHKLLGKLLKDLLSPVDIQVFPDAPVMSKSPEIDVVLIKRNPGKWTPAQLALLPDGIRDTQVTDILLEFKYTESLSEKAVQQALTYDFLYKAHKTDEKQVQSFLLSATKPQNSTLKKLGYKSTKVPGIYRSKFQLVRQIILISLNELSNEPYNAFVKCFATHRQEKQKAFDSLEQSGLLNSSTNELKWFILGLKGLWFTEKGDDMNLEMTAEQVAELGKIWGNAFLSSLSVEELLEHYDRQKILSQFKPQERLAGLKPQDILTQLKPQERLAGLKPQELDELQEYLKKREQKKEN
ncbi:MAG: hypothetical protein ABFS56_29725 [Pseudomonadota bacterium]